MSSFTPHAEYHADIDILYVTLSDAEVTRSGDLDLWRNIDLAADGTVVGIEFVNASAGVNLRDVPQYAEVERLIRGFNRPVVV